MVWPSSATRRVHTRDSGGMGNASTSIKKTIKILPDSLPRRLPLIPNTMDVPTGFFQPRQLLQTLSGSELQLHNESSSNRSESSKLNRSHSSLLAAFAFAFCCCGGLLLLLLFPALLLLLLLLLLVPLPLGPFHSWMAPAAAPSGCGPFWLLAAPPPPPPPPASCCCCWLLFRCGWSWF